MISAVALPRFQPRRWSLFVRGSIANDKNSAVINQASSALSLWINQNPAITDKKQAITVNVALGIHEGISWFGLFGFITSFYTKDLVRYKTIVAVSRPWSYLAGCTSGSSIKNSTPPDSLS